ncbi:16S rRNA (adenine(1518)-N(6)/adenine(1519)-N(6))-dimethyltransferase RsmA [Micrococcus lylae]|uniref:16S rRNA (adenine(1518)-N(6)/adenine(1519)-N(6))- dimethyltransferase RsmA n=1 Tax=Micrococcus lylae TaxID=1273 RepID=UPI003EB8431A
MPDHADDTSAAPGVAPLLSAADIRRIAAELDLRPTKSWGQNFVIDPNTIRRIVVAAALAEDEHVLEVGPGLGSLTLGLMDAAAAVTAVEIDPTTAARLPATASAMRAGASERLAVLHGDAMTVTPEEVDAVRPAAAQSGPTALVANLPYNVAVPVLLHVLEHFPDIRHGLVMVQEEVADRLAAGPGSKVYGVPSAKAAWYGPVRKVGTIGTQVFWPAPRIHSGLVAFERAAQPPVAGVEREDVFAVVDAAFAQRRKTLRAALSGWAGGASAAEDALRAAGVEPQTRGETLGIADFARIAAARGARVTEETA